MSTTPLRPKQLALMFDDVESVNRTVRMSLFRTEPDPRDLPIGHPETMCDCGRCHLDGSFPSTWQDFLSYMKANDSPIYPQREIGEERAAIYALVDPRYAQAPVRYVGLTSHFEKRYYAHCIQLNKHTHKTHWIADVLRSGYLPVMREIADVPYEERAEAERLWVERMRRAGARLTNSTMGGETGGQSYHTVESLRRQSASTRIEPDSTEPRSKHYTWHTPESAAKIVAANKGEANHQAKLTWEKVRRMRELMAEGYMNKEVAEMFGVSITQTTRIRLNRSWREET